MQEGQYRSVRYNGDDVTTHSLLCLVDYYHSIAEVDILVTS